MGKIESFGFFNKVLIMPKMGNMGHFCAQNQHFGTILQIYCLDVFEIVSDVTVAQSDWFHFYGKFSLYPKLEK